MFFSVIFENRGFLQNYLCKEIITLFYEMFSRCEQLLYYNIQLQHSFTAGYIGNSF